MQKEQMLVGPDPDRVRTEHLDLVPGRRIAGRPLSLGEDARMGKKQRTPSTVVPPACVCVCVLSCGIKEGMSS